MFLKRNAPNLTDSSIIEESEDPEASENIRSRYKAHTLRKRKYYEDDFENEILQSLKNAENRHVYFLNQFYHFLKN